MLTTLQSTRRTRRSGFTLIEVAVTAVVLVMMMGMLGVVSMTSQSAYSTSTLAAKLDGQGRHTLTRVSDELTMILGSTMQPDPFGSRGTEDLDFEQALGVLNGAVIKGPTTRIGFDYEVGEVDDGQDNDGDGLVDEGVVSLTRDVGTASEKRVVLCRNVREMAVGESFNGIDDNGNGLVDEGGFNIHRIGDVMVVRLWLETPAPGGETIGQQHQISVRLRNVGQ